jgi:hypothetical protein
VLGYTQIVDSLQDILGKKNFAPPDEMGAIRIYVKQHYNSACRVKLQRDALILSVPSSALAATIYLERESLIEACGLKKKLVVRAGR